MFRCEKFEENGSASLYKFYKSSSRVNWFAAEKFCKESGEQLPSIHSDKEWEMFA